MLRDAMRLPRQSLHNRLARHWQIQVLRNNQTTHVGGRRGGMGKRPVQTSQMQLGFQTRRDKLIRQPGIVTQTQPGKFQREAAGVAASADLSGAEIPAAAGPAAAAA